MARVRVENFASLVRDTNSNAIINVNKSDFELYMAQRKQREQRGDELRGAIKEINTLKQELFEIKKMIKEGFKK
tara:strand:+ start:525 stop:746 length:222 start_codon:yes stop_codon:yes gene_type:complete